jgi:hypothetical protein
MWNRTCEIHHPCDTCCLGPQCVVLENYIGTTVYFCWTVSFKTLHPILENKPTFKQPQHDYSAEVEYEEYNYNPTLLTVDFAPTSYFLDKRI